MMLINPIHHSHTLYSMMRLIQFTFETLKTSHLFSKVKLPIKREVVMIIIKYQHSSQNHIQVFQVGSRRNNNRIAEIMFLKQLNYQSSACMIKMEQNFSLRLPTENAIERTHRLSFVWTIHYFSVFSLK